MKSRCVDTVGYFWLHLAAIDSNVAPKCIQPFSSGHHKMSIKSREWMRLEPFWIRVEPKMDSNPNPNPLGKYRESAGYKIKNIFVRKHGKRTKDGKLDGDSVGI